MDLKPRLTSRPTRAISPRSLAEAVAAYAHTDITVPVLAFAPLRRARRMSGSAEPRELSGSVVLAPAGEAVVSIDGRAGGLELREGEPASFELSDGSRLTAPDPFVSGQGASLAVDRPSRFTTEMLLSEWRWSTGRPPVAWVGNLHGPSFRASNILVQSHSRTSLQGLRVHGNAAWHLVRQGATGKRTCIVLVGGDGADLFPEAVARDFCALEFLFGTALRLDLLVGVDETNAPVEAFGTSLGYRYREGSSQEPPVPDDRDNAWIAAAFPRIVATLGSGPLASATSAAACHYVDSTMGHIDGQYLFLQVALEALSSQILWNEPPLVKDVAAWKRWIDSLSVQCEGHAVDASALKILLGKLRGAYRPTTSRLVEKTLKRSGLAVPTEAIDELEGRNIVAQTGSMTGGDPYDVERELRRIRMIQTLLAALILRTAGYEGELLGWDLDTLRSRKPAKWFLASQAAREESRHIYEVVQTGQ